MTSRHWRPGQYSAYRDEYPIEEDGERIGGFADPNDTQLAAAAPAMYEACRAALAHIDELRSAWQTGALSECDGGGGARSNRNVDVGTQLRAALAAAEGRDE